MATITVREFSRDVSAAKRTAAAEPVMITDQGEPAFVLLSIAEYRRLSESLEMVERLCMEGDHDIAFEPVALNLKVPDL